MMPISIMKPDLSRIPGDLGDARFNNYILEHGHRYITGKEANYWDVKFMYPYKNVVACSDNLLGTLPVYSVFRGAGCDRETSFQLWLISLFALNFIGCFLAMKEWSKKITLSAVAAYVYAFSIFNIGHLNHVQVFPRFMIPLIIYWMYRYLSTKETKYFLFSTLGLVLQFYCGIYLGIFTVTTLVVLFLAYLLVYRDKGYFTQFARGPVILYHLVIIAIGSALMYPLIEHYTLTSETLGFFRFEEVKGYIPELRSYVFATDVSYTWNKLSHHSVEHFPQFWNNYLFPGIIPFTGILLLPFVMLSRKINKPKKQFIAFTALALFLDLIFHLKFGDFTLYEYIFSIPGFSSIRSVDRIINVQIILFLILMVFCLDQLIKVNKYTRLLIFILPVLVVADNLIKPDYAIKFSKAEAQARTRELQKFLTSTYDNKHEALAYIPFNLEKEQQFKIHLDAMIVCQDLGFPCVNAYTGKFPGAYADLYERLDYPSLGHWCDETHTDIKGIAAINELGTFTQDASKNFLQASNKLYLSAESDARVIADKPHTALWEEFNILKYNSGEVILKTYANQFLYIDTLNGGKLKYQSELPDLKQSFEMINSGPKTFSLKDSRGKYLRLDTGDNFIYADIDSISSQSEFNIAN